MSDFQQFETWLDRLPVLPVDATENQYRAFTAEIQRWQVSSTMVMATALQENTSESKLTRVLYERVLDVLDPKSPAKTPPPPMGGLGAHVDDDTESVPIAPVAHAVSPVEASGRDGWADGAVKVLGAVTELVKAFPAPAWWALSAALLAAVLGAYHLSYTDGDGRRIGATGEKVSMAENEDADTEAGGGGLLMQPSPQP